LLADLPVQFPQIKASALQAYTIGKQIAEVEGVVSLKSPIWSLHFHDLVLGCPDFFHAHFSHSNRQNVRHRQRFRDHGFALSIGHR
jgi:hypothetical protein